MLKLKQGNNSAFFYDLHVLYGFIATRIMRTDHNAQCISVSVAHDEIRAKDVKSSKSHQFDRSKANIELNCINNLKYTTDARQFITPQRQSMKIRRHNKYFHWNAICFSRYACSWMRWIDIIFKFLLIELDDIWYEWFVDKGQCILLFGFEQMFSITKNYLNKVLIDSIYVLGKKEP